MKTSGFRTILYCAFSVSALVLLCNLAAVGQGGILAEQLAGIDSSRNLRIFSWTPQCDWMVQDVPQVKGQIWSPLASWQTPDGPYLVDHLAGKSAAGELLLLFKSARQNWQTVNVSAEADATLANSRVSPLYAPTAWQTRLPGAANLEHLTSASAGNELLVFSFSPGDHWRVINATQNVRASQPREFVSGSLTAWQRPEPARNGVTEFVAGLDPYGDLVVFSSFRGPNQPAWQPGNIDVQNISAQIAPHQRYFAPLTSWLSPLNGSENLAAMTTNGELIVIRIAPSLNFINVTALTGQAINGPVISWQTQDGPNVVEHLAANSPSGDLLVFYSSATSTALAWQTANVVNVSQSRGLPQIRSGPFGAWQTTDGSFNIEHIAGISSPTGNLLVFFWSPRADWQTVDISVKADGQQIFTQGTSWQTPNQLPPCDVVTQHNDNARSGAYLAEKQLTPETVSSDRFTRLYSRYVDGDIVAQPLYTRRVPTLAGVKNLFFVATAKNMLYAFDADDTAQSAPPIWSRSLGCDPQFEDCSPQSSPWLPTARRLCIWLPGNTTDPANCSLLPGSGRFNSPEVCSETRGGYVGVTSTPVIDPVTNVMYVVSRRWNRTRQAYNPLVDILNPSADMDSKDFLYAINIGDGSDRMRPQEIEATASNGERFQARCHRNRPGLLLLNGVVYVAYGTFQCDQGCPGGTYHGWVLGYRASNIQQQTGVFATSGGGAGIWQTGNGLAGAPDGTVYFETGNDFDNRTSPLGDSFVKLRVESAGLVQDRPPFRPNNQATLRRGDTDLGSGGPLLLPGNRLIGGGKQGIFYVLDQNTMALTQDRGDPAPPPPNDVPFPSNLRFDGFQAFTNTWHPEINQHDYQRGEGFGPNIHAGPVYWEPDPNGQPPYGLIYKMPEKDYLKAFRYDLTGAYDQMGAYHVRASPVMAATGVGARPPDGMPGGFSSLSANGAHDGVIWTWLPRDSDAQWTNVTGRLVAFDATNLARGPLWSDSSWTFAKSVPPTVADGKLFLATFQDRVVVYGLRNCTICGPPPPVDLIRGVSVEEPDCPSSSEAYARVGGPAGILGTPLDDEIAIGDVAKGKYRHYRGSLIGLNPRVLSIKVSVHTAHPSCSHPERGNVTEVESSIYWSDRTCAHILQGDIRDLWLKLGAQNSRLGYPTSDEMNTPDGQGRMSKFEHGEIWWYPDQGAYIRQEPPGHISP
jgi:hypothetical protein